MEHRGSQIVGAGRGRRQVRILFTCAGRRIELIQAFIRAAKALGVRLSVHAADIEPHFAAACLADRAHRTPSIGSPRYISTIREIARREKIDLIVPLIDPELPALSEAREKFAEFGCHLIISSPRIVQICRDKLTTYQFLTQNDIPTPQTWLPGEVLARARHRFPYFLKPRFGSASKGNFIIRDRHDLESFVPRVPDAIIQELLPGEEHTLDVYTGYDGRPRCVVPRRRLEVRGGEVTKAVTVRHDGIIQTGVRVVEALGECRGLITIQLFLAGDGQIRVIEVNPRFGGGVPLAIQAGADFPKWLLVEWLGERPRIRLDNFRPGVLMLRYHQSFFKENVLDG
jgi:carbamoyl-phosphate synthase large subunit